MSDAPVASWLTMIPSPNTPASPRPRPIRLGADDGRVRLYLPAFTWSGSDAQEPSPDLAVLLRGREVLVFGPPDAVRRVARVDETLELRDTLVTPGLVNWHTHLELSHLSPPPAPAEGPDGFVDWLLTVMASGPRSGGEAAEVAEAAANKSFSLGVTEIHDICRHPREVRSALAGLPVRVFSYAEVTGLGHRLKNADAMIDAGLDVPEDAELRYPNLVFGFAPHAPYSTDRSVYLRCHELATELDWALTTHLGETTGEEDFVCRLSGPFRRLWDHLGGLPDDTPRLVSPFPDGQFCSYYASRAGLSYFSSLHDWPFHGGDPSELLRKHPHPQAHTVLLAHLNATTDADREGFKHANAAPVHCPRTHAYFKRNPAVFRRCPTPIPWRLGTDSTASAGDLDPLEEIRLLRRHHPDLPARSLFAGAVRPFPTSPAPVTSPMRSGPSALAWPAASPHPLDDLIFGLPRPMPCK